MVVKNKHKRKTPYAPDSTEAFGFLASAFRLRSLNKRVSGSGFQPSPKSPSATSDTRQPLCDMAVWKEMNDNE